MYTLRKGKLGLLACAIFALAARSALALPLFGGALPVTTYYASPTGSGSSCTSTNPCSLATVQTTVETALAATGPTLIVCLADGNYRITSAIALTSADSGQPGRQVTWTDCLGSGHTAAISGGVQVTGWTLCTTADTVCNSGANGVYQASVASPSDFREAYFAGAHGIRARGPFQPASWAVGGCSATGVCSTSTGVMTAPSSGTQPKSTSLNPTQIELVFQQGWMTSFCKISTIVTTAITLQTPCVTSMIDAFWPQTNVPGATNTPAYVENQYELLPYCSANFTTNGCWYYDVIAQILYYAPIAGQAMTGGSAIDVEVPLATSPLVTITGAANLTFSQLTFEYSSWLDPDVSGHGYVDEQGGYHCPSPHRTNCRQETMLTTDPNIPAGVDVSSGSNNLTFSHDTFTHNSGRGLWFEHGTQNATVYATICTDNAGGCLQAGDITDYAQTNASLQTANITVKDLSCTNEAFEYNDTPCVFAPIALNFTLTNSSMDHPVYDPVQTGWWGWQQYSNQKATYNANNNITNNKTNTSCVFPHGDCGDFYNNGPQVNMTISGNYSVGLGGNSTKNRNATWYPDEHSANIAYSNNVSDGAVPGGTCNFTTNTNECVLYVNNSGVGLSVNNSWATALGCEIDSAHTTTCTGGTNVTWGTVTSFTSGSPPAGAQIIINAAGIEAGVTPGP